MQLQITPQDEQRLDMIERAKARIALGIMEGPREFEVVADRLLAAINDDGPQLRLAKTDKD